MTTKRDAVRRVFLITLAFNLAVALAKILLGLISGALAITADGLHSLIDSSGNIVGLVANQIAWRPADEEHPYGHRRFEVLATLIIGALLLLTALEIVRGVIERLNAQTAPTITPLSFAVMLATLAVNIAVNRYQVRRGRQLQSPLLLADAAHTGADIIVTISVLFSMSLVALGLHWADTLVALAVVLLILRAAWGIIAQTARILVDTAPYSSAELRAIIQPLLGDALILRARSRGPRDAAHIDIDIQVPPEMTVTAAAALADTIRRRLHQRLDGVAEVEVHFAPSPRP